MEKYVANPKPEKSVKVFGRGLRISTKDSVIICKSIKGLSLPKGKTFLDDLIHQRVSIGGKYYTGAAQEVFSLLNSAESTTEFKGLAPERMFISASAHKGFRFQTPRRFKQRGRRRMVTHIQLILEQR